MKKKFKVLVSILLVLSLAGLTACGSIAPTQQTTSNQEAKTIKLKASSGLSKTHSWQTGFYDPVMAKVTKDTNGAVEFDVFTSGELVKFTKELDALKSGTIDVALSFCPYMDPARFPYSEVGALPLLGADVVIMTNAYKNLYNSTDIIKDGKTYKQLEFDDKGIVAIPGVGYPPYVIATTGHKFEKVSDFSTKIKLRSPNRCVELVSDNLGITPVTLPTGDMYDALSRKAIDGVYLPPDWIVNGLDPLLKYGIRGYEIGVSFTYIAFTKEKWDSLPAAVQKSFNDAIEAITNNAFKVLNDNAKTNWDSLGAGVVEFKNLDPAVQKHMSDAAAKTWMDWIAKADAAGVPGKKMAILWRDCVIKAGADVPQAIKDLK